MSRGEEGRTDSEARGGWVGGTVRWVVHLREGRRGVEDGVVRGSSEGSRRVRHGGMYSLRTNRVSRGCRMVWRTYEGWRVTEVSREVLEDVVES